MWLFLIPSIIIVAADRIIKLIVFESFSPGSSYPLIKGVLYITPTYNKGIAFGLLKDSSGFILISFSSLTIIFITYLLISKRPRSPLLLSGLFLLLSGAIGNLVDRIVYGHVLDFIDIRVWPVFNISDSAITIGVSLIIWYLLRTRGSEEDIGG